MGCWFESSPGHLTGPGARAAARHPSSLGCASLRAWLASLAACGPGSGVVCCSRLLRDTLRPALSTWGSARFAAALGAVALVVASLAVAEVSPELDAAIATTRTAYPKLLKPPAEPDRYFGGVDDAELDDADGARRLRASGTSRREAAVWVVLEGFSREQGPAATYGRDAHQRHRGHRGGERRSRDAARCGADPRPLPRRREPPVLDPRAGRCCPRRSAAARPRSATTTLVQRITAAVNPDRELSLRRHRRHGRRSLRPAPATRTCSRGGARRARRGGGLLRHRARLAATAAQTWDAPDTGTDEPLYAVALGPDDELWAAGRAGVVVRSDDGGRSLLRRATPVRPPRVRPVRGRDRATLLAVGDFGLQLRTRDAGAHWTCIPREQDVILGRIAPAGRRRGAWSASSARSSACPTGTPPGRAATLAGVPEDFYVFDVWFDDRRSRSAIAVGLSGPIVRSEDGGASWSRVAVRSREDLFGVGRRGDARRGRRARAGCSRSPTDGGQTFAQGGARRRCPSRSPTWTSPTPTTCTRSVRAGWCCARRRRRALARSCTRGERRVSAAERFSRFFARRRNWFALAIALVTGFFAWQLRHLEIYTQFLDLLPRAHPFIRTYEALPRRLRQREHRGGRDRAAQDGDIYQPEMLRAIAAADREARLLGRRRRGERVSRPAPTSSRSGVDRPRGTRAGVARRPRRSRTGSDRDGRDRRRPQPGHEPDRPHRARRARAARRHPASRRAIVE